MGTCTSNSRSDVYRVELAPFERKRLAIQPAYQMTIGNLSSVCAEIERSIMKFSETEIDCKENKPFITVVCPPRHGKSLLLDMVFKDNNNFLVIPITYNNATNICELETSDSANAIKYFWIRVLKALLGVQDSLMEVCERYNEHVHVWSYQVVKRIAAASLPIDPFTHKNGSKKNVIICVDEFSLLTDIAGEKWDSIEKQSFIGNIRDCMRHCSPIVQFVFTGFHSTMEDMMMSSALVDNYVLTLCSFSSSAPLLKKVCSAYDAVNIPVPMLLFQAIKSTPGLVGLWAERVVGGNLDINLHTFQRHTVWLNKIVTEPSLSRNWSAIVRFIECIEHCGNSNSDQSTELALCGNQLINQLIAVGAYENNPPQIIPLCFVLITKAASQLQDMQPWVKSLHGCLLFIFEACQAVSPQSQSARTGQQFENFVLWALRCRFILRAQGKAPMFIALSQLLPGRRYKGQVAAEGSAARQFLLHIIVKKTELQRLLLPPLYYLFPLGFDSLHERERTSSPAMDWVATNSQEYSLTETDTIAEHMCCCGDDVADKAVSLVLSLEARGKEEESVPAACLSEIFKDLSQFPEHFCSSESFAAYLKTSSKFSLKQLKVLGRFYRLMISNLKVLLCSACTCSLIRTTKDAEGADLILIWRELGTQRPSNLRGDVEGDDESALDEGPHGQSAVTTTHIAALELKDRRDTSVEEWDKKMKALTSLRCIVYWANIYAVAFDLSAAGGVQFHIVLAGREHSS